MKPNILRFASASLMSVVGACSAWASEAQTSATAGRNGGRGSGTAAASARYEGDQGFARTDTRSGAVNLARGVAVGVDEDGLSLSISGAIAAPNSPAVATTLNITINRDGQVATSSGVSIADGPSQRSATAGGATGSGRIAPTATAAASGRTDARGRVDASTRSHVGRGPVVLAGGREIRRIPVR